MRDVHARYECSVCMRDVHVRRASPPIATEYAIVAVEIPRRGRCARPM
jgi:hypothetical protein